MSDSSGPLQPNGAKRQLRAGSRAVGRMLSGMRIRKKLIILHTSFSMVLAGILALALRPAIREVVARSELHEARLIAELALVRSLDETSPTMRSSVRLMIGAPGDVGLSPAEESRVRDGLPDIGRDVRTVVVDQPRDVSDRSPRVAAYDPQTDRFAVVSVRLDGARDAVVRLYLLMTVALLAVYGLVAAALEIFVLPRHVYAPIRRLLDADLAVQEGRRDDELIEAEFMPADELGEIMRSRNGTVSALRQHERDLADAMRRLEEIATDMKRKNHLLEMAKRNLADADRLASLGVMSAGLAHELNTPLTVLKGLSEKVARSAHAKAAASATSGDVEEPGARALAGLSPSEAELMLRVVGRLEKLSESLLDFARVRPAEKKRVQLAALIDEAWTLVRLDRTAGDVQLTSQIAADAVVECDADRMLQVLVNLLRNAVDAMESSAGLCTIEVALQLVERDAEHWVSLTITDSGPGIDAEVLARLFEPFVSTRLDSRGTGLGLAVSQGIVNEHGGLLLARNRKDRSGAVFEVLLPVSREEQARRAGN